MSANHVSAETPVQYQDEYGRSFGVHQSNHLSMRVGGQMDAVQYNASQQGLQHVPSLIHSSSRFPAPNGIRTSMDRSQPSTPAITAFPPILPSQKLHAEPAPTSASTYSSLAQSKRGLPDAVTQETIRSPKRRPAAIPASVSAQNAMENSGQALDLSEEEQLLVQLKQDQNLPWKEIAKEFEDRLGRSYAVPALQMRYKRLRERMRRWTNEDIAALMAAHEYWASNKFEIIANKMADFGIQDRWPARYCDRKLQELYPDASKTDTGTMFVEKGNSQQPLPTNFDTGMQNHSIAWSIPSPPGENKGSGTPFSERGNRGC